MEHATRRIVEYATRRIEPVEAQVEITMTMPESRAQALAQTISGKITWRDTDCEDELRGLYMALLQGMNN